SAAPRAAGRHGDPDDKTCQPRRLLRRSRRSDLVTRDPLLITTAVEAVTRAGDMMMAHFGGDVRVSKKGTIDLVTEVDVAVERAFRALITERFPSHAVLGEELGGDQGVPAGYCWVFDPIDGT